MKKLMLSLTLCGLFASPADALTAHLKGKKADAIIAKHFPEASIPGPVEGAFTYGAFHYKRFGHASCNAPAMGARSDGAVSTCTVVY